MDRKFCTITRNLQSLMGTKSNLTQDTCLIRSNVRSLNCGRGGGWGNRPGVPEAMGSSCFLPSVPFGPVKRPHMEEATGHWSLRPAFHRPILCASFCGPADSAFLLGEGSSGHQVEAESVRRPLSADLPGMP